MLMAFLSAKKRVRLRAPTVHTDVRASDTMSGTFPTLRSVIGGSVFWFALAAVASAEPLDCTADPDACVRTLIAETAVFMEACGKAFPQSRNGIDAAMKRWVVLKLAIPRLDEAMAHDSALQVGLRKSVTSYFEQIPDDEKAIECEGRIETLLSPTPAIAGDSAKLPPDALRKYEK